MANFSLDFLNADSNNAIQYLPSGVTTIEMHLKENMVSGNIKPKQHSLGKEGKRFVGFADNTENMLVVWGGGEKKGQYVKTNMAGRFFFQLIHLGNEHEKMPTTLTLTHDGVMGEQQVSLDCACNQNDIVRMVGEKAENDLKLITFEGIKVPSYYPRWFPPRPKEGKTIEYNKVAYPVFSVEFVESGKSVDSPLSIYLHDDKKTSLHEDEKKKKICSLEGDLDYAEPHIELFTLPQVEGAFVIRVWLYWIHQRFRGNFFYGYKSLNIPKERNFRKLLQKGTLEVPDIERFDFVFDSRLGRVTWFGTDFHYQEHWGKVNGEVAEARIAGGLDIVSEVLKRMRDRPLPDWLRSVAEWMGILQREKGGKYDLVSELAKRLNGSYGPDVLKLTPTPDFTPATIEDETRIFRKPGDIRTHVPYLLNGEVDHDMVSNVVSSVME